jgi:hypothetical protein
VNGTKRVKMDKRTLVGLVFSATFISQAAAQPIDELLYPLCKFDYDLMWIILVVAPAICAFLLVYNGVKLQSDSENTRSSGKKGMKNAIIGLILIIAFSAIGCNFIPACVPCPLTPYTAPTNPAKGVIPLNVWIVEPANGASFFVGTTVNVRCKIRGPVASIIWNFNDPFGKTPVKSVAFSGTEHTDSYTYTMPGEYSIMVTALDAYGNTAQHRIKVRIKAKLVTKKLVGPCSNTVQDPGETDVNCGGSTCPKCAIEKKCSVNGDCVSNWCNGGICDDGGTCDDGKKNGGETKIDCGGPICIACLSGCSNKPSLEISGIHFYNPAGTEVFGPLSPGTYTVKVDFSCSFKEDYHIRGAYNFEKVEFAAKFFTPQSGSSYSGGLTSYNCLNGEIGSNTAQVTVVGGEESFEYTVKADIVDLNEPSSDCGNTNMVRGPALIMVSET